MKSNIYYLAVWMQKEDMPNIIECDYTSNSRIECTTKEALVHAANLFEKVKLLPRFEKIELKQHFKRTLKVIKTFTA